MKTATSHLRTQISCSPGKLVWDLEARCCLCCVDRFLLLFGADFFQGPMSDLYIEFGSNMAFAVLELTVRRPMDGSHHRCCSGSPYLKHKNKTLMRRYYRKCGMDYERYPKVARSCDERCEERAGMTAVQVRKLPEGGSVKRNMFTRMETLGE